MQKIQIMVNSDVVARGLIAAYTLYALAAIVLFAWFASRITKPNKAPVVKPVLFYAFFALLVAIGVSIHLTTMETIPWVKVDMHANKLTPDTTITMQVDSFTFYVIDAKGKKIRCCDQPIRVKNHQMVLFDVYSSDLTYGFGLFRSNNTLVFQMQLLPLYHNKLLWKFNETGTFSLRSTEYAGPKGTKMMVQNFLIVE